MDEDVGVKQARCYQFELKILHYDVEFSVSVPKADCHVMQKLVKPKTLKITLNKEELAVPFPIILRNGRSDGYAIIEQIKLFIESKS